MIELIFAIVIMGLVMMSAPMMISTATQSAETTFQQESIAIAATKISNITTYAWDQSNTQAAHNGNGLNRVLAVSSAGENELEDRNGTFKRQPIDVNITASAKSDFGSQQDFDTEANTTETRNNDIDDFDNNSFSLSVTNDASGSQSTATSSDKGGYMDVNLTIATEVKYINDNANYASCSTSSNGCAFSNPFSGASPAGTTNIKMIQVTLTSSNVADKKIVLKSFACNIGAVVNLEEGTF
jgi:hypothetical protein